MIREAESKKRITVKVIDEENGISVIENVTGVRIKSSDYRVLVLPDFAPLLGEIHGSIIVLKEDGEISYDDMDGYYKLQDNEFTCIINKEYNGWYRKE